MEQIDQLNQWVQESAAIVFLGGAGVSTESGIPDFRSTDGIYSQKYEYPPEVILSHSFYMQNPDYFFRFYREKMLYLGAQPNMAHRKLAELESAGKLNAVITQNIDGLHQKAGSKNVIELHGSVYRNTCEQCGRKYDVSYVAQGEGIPLCECGGRVKPDVVLYEEMLYDGVLENAERAIRDADMMIVGGTSLNVYPAAGLIHYYGGEKLVLINRQPTSFDRGANLVIKGNIGEVLGQIDLSK